MTSVFQGSSQTKKYLYEDNNDSRLLTGIIDERGIRYATWKYDPHGRAISSEHAQGAEKTTIQYHSDDTTTVSNALGKSTTYKFGYFQGIKHITSIIGEPTANCPKVIRHLLTTSAVFWPRKLITKELPRFTPIMIVA